MRGGKALAVLCASWSQVVGAIDLDITDTSMYIPLRHLHPEDGY
jgi:hypothetical protein